MFFSLLQTLICVLLVNSGLYALHLTGSNTPGPATGLNSNSGQPHAVTSQINKAATNPFQTTGQRLNEELADLAQLERERLMVLGLVKQTAESESGYHGRPVVTGRIQMHPTEDMDSEYANWLSQQNRNIMFGNVVKEPLNEEEDYDTGGGVGVGVAPDIGVSNIFNPLRSEHKYDYGRIVQPLDKEREREFDNPHNIDLDDFMELESVPDEEEIFPDMDGYAYIEELMAEGNKERLQHHYQPPQHLQMLQFPGQRQQQQQQQHQQHQLPLSHSYPSHENMGTNKQMLQDFFDREQQLQIPLSHHQQQQQQQQHQQQHQDNQLNAKYRNNVRMQQKWLHKRNQLQQQQQLPRNIFGQKNAKHHFDTFSSNKLALANSEATATTRTNNNNKQTDIAQQIKNAEQQQHHHQQQQQQKQQQKDELNVKDDKDNKQKTSSVSDKTLKFTQQQQHAEQLQQPNHKRSGLIRTPTMENGDTTATVHSPQMLRKVRGQRQYDVPQIECPTAMDGMERFACPTPDLQGRYRCIDDHVLCDGFIDCPEGEDEDRRSCMFYKTTKAHLDVLADALLRWARGR